MAKSLLDMVNDLRGKARSGGDLTSIASNDEESGMMVRMLNRAMRTVLESHDWPFDERYDGSIVFDAPFTISEATGATLEEGTEAIAWGNQADFQTIVDRVHGDPWRVQFPGATSANTSYRATFITGTANFGGSLTLGISPGFVDSTTLSDPEIYFFHNEAILPSTVRQVLSVRHQERPLQVDFVERNIAFDRLVPREFDRTGQPEWVSVYGSYTSTYDTSTSTTADTGLGMMIWPLPDQNTKLDLTYVYRHPDLSGDADTLDGVPDHIVNLIVERAWLYMLTSNVESDPSLANQARVDFNAEFAEAKSRMRPSPTRRRIPRQRGLRRSPWASWDSQEIPSS